MTKFRSLWEVNQYLKKKFPQYQITLNHGHSGLYFYDAANRVSGLDKIHVPRIKDLTSDMVMDIVRPVVARHEVHFNNATRALSQNRASQAKAYEREFSKIFRESNQ